MKRVYVHEHFAAYWEHVRVVPSGEEEGNDAPLQRTTTDISSLLGGPFSNIARERIWTVISVLFMVFGGLKLYCRYLYRPAGSSCIKGSRSNFR